MRNRVSWPDLGGTLRQEEVEDQPCFVVGAFEAGIRCWDQMLGCCCWDAASPPIQRLAQLPPCLHMPAPIPLKPPLFAASVGTHLRARAHGRLGWAALSISRNRPRLLHQHFWTSRTPPNYFYAQPANHHHLSATLSTAHRFKPRKESHPGTHRETISTALAMASIGPQLPPHLQKRKRTPEDEDLGSPPPKASRRSNDDEIPLDDDSDDDYGPKAPTLAVKNRTAAGPARPAPSIGPSIGPSVGPSIGPSRPPTNNDEIPLDSDSDSDAAGPAPPPRKSPPIGLRSGGQLSNRPSLR